MKKILAVVLLAGGILFVSVAYSPPEDHPPLSELVKKSVTDVSVLDNSTYTVPELPAMISKEFSELVEIGKPVARPLNTVANSPPADERSPKELNPGNRIIDSDPICA